MKAFFRLAYPHMFLMSMDYDNNVAPAKDSDGSDGYDGSRDSARDVNDNNVIVVTATNQQEIGSNIMEKGQGTIPGAVTAVTAVTAVHSPIRV